MNEADHKPTTDLIDSWQQQKRNLETVIFSAGCISQTPDGEGLNYCRRPALRSATESERDLFLAWAEAGALPPTGASTAEQMLISVLRHQMLLDMDNEIFVAAQRHLGRNVRYYVRDAARANLAAMERMIERLEKPAPQEPASPNQETAHETGAKEVETAAA